VNLPGQSAQFSRRGTLGRGGESLTIGQFFSLKGRKSAAKHVFAGTTRVATKIVPPPGWQPASADVVTAAPGEPPSGSNLPGCQPSDFQPQKCDAYPGGDPIIIGPPGNKVRPVTYYYHSDHLGSTGWVTDQNGQVREHVEYFPFGQVWRDVRADADGPNALDQRFLFTGKELDEETGLYYFGARYLDPLRARWISADPADLFTPEYNGRMTDSAGSVMGQTPSPATLNRYSYVLNNPYKFTDPNGKSPLPLIDAGFILFDIGSYAYHAATGDDEAARIDLAALAIDSALALLPGPPGMGAAARTAEHGAEIVLLHAGTKETAQAVVKAEQVEARVSSKTLRREWEAEHGQQWPKDPATGKNQDAAHIKALADGGTNQVSNIKPQPRAEHVKEHSDNGDFSRWGARSQTGGEK
jgi:RHS repeat-associated protein